MTIPKGWAMLLAIVYTATMAIFLVWASTSASVFALPDTLTSEPWFVTTCVDAWLGLSIITLWTWCFELSWPKRVLWFVLIMGLGNVGVGLYLMKRVYAMPRLFGLRDFFLTPTQSLPSHQTPEKPEELANA